MGEVGPTPGGRVDVLGVLVSAVDPARAVERVAGFVRDGAREYVCVTGVHGVMESRRDAVLRDVHNAAGLVVPDGMPLVWAGRYAGAASMAQVRGSDFMLDLCRRAEQEGWSSYFYGGSPEALDQLLSVLTTRFPRLRVAGAHSPPYRPLTEVEQAEVVAAIDAAAPDLVWVGLSTPKQERWMAHFRPRLQAPVLLGVGAAFDMNAGRLPQAPEVLRRLGLEWAYRVYREPGRLWKRYAVAVPGFLLGVLRRPPRCVDAGP